MREQIPQTAYCRGVNKEELSQVMELWQTCFDDTTKFVIWYFARYWKPEYTLGIFETEAGKETLCASAQVIPYQLQIRDTDLSCGYIVGVDTAPMARNKGYAKRLLWECLSMQRENKQAISLLMPFEGQFYYRYGWSFCYMHQRLITEPQELRCAAKPWGNVRKVELFAAQEEMARIYRQFAIQYHGMVNRTDVQWRLQLEDAQMEHTACFLIEDENREVQGYFLWTPLKGQCFVREMIWCHERAKAGMLYYLMQNIAKDEKIWLDLPEIDTLRDQLATKKSDMVLYPFLMARIVDVKLCLEAISYPLADGELLLTVQDAFTDWNTGTYQIVIREHRAQVNQIEETMQKQLQVKGIVSGSITIDGLSQLVMGYRSAKQLAYQEILCCQDTMRESLLGFLDQIWPVQHNFINEYY